MNEQGNNSSPKVLIIEDDPSVARMLRFSLRTARFDVTEVGTGGEALQLIERQPIDAVVLDLGLPDGLGGAVLAWLRQHDGQTNSSPVWVAISALDVDDATSRYGPLKGHFLGKPFDPWDLISILEGFLSAKGKMV